MLEDMEGAAFEGTLEQEHISMLSVKNNRKSWESEKRLWPGHRYKYKHSITGAVGQKVS